MAKVLFAPFYAVKYIGSETKEFTSSLARPRPSISTGDIVIVDKRTAFNLVEKGFGDFEMVSNIELTVMSEDESKSDDTLGNKIKKAFKGK